jgi:uncharacterized protein (TIGR02266 family)
MAEQRNEVRAEVEIEIHYRTAQEFLAAYSKNISGGGIFVRTPQPQALNQAVLVRFTLPGLPNRFEFRGIVVWNNTSTRGSFPTGMGIKFLDISSKDAETLADFAAKAAAAQSPAPEAGPTKPTKKT